MEESGKSSSLKSYRKTAIFILCWSITLYLFYSTMIGIVPFLMLLAFSSLFGTLVFYKKLNRWGEEDISKLNFTRRFLLHFLFHCTLGCGAITMLIFLTTNKIFSDNEEKRVVVNVVDKSAGSRYRYFTIIYDEERLNILADAQTIEQCELPLKLELRLRNGFWGYDVVKDWEIVGE